MGLNYDPNMTQDEAKALAPKLEKLAAAATVYAGDIEHFASTGRQFNSIVATREAFEAALKEFTE